jgi:EAL domain-containing protein (putative c-di-GMP-specific phosphodiesterase class I)
MAESLIKSSSLDPNRLKLELTESCIMMDPHTSIDKMSSLRSLGVGFAIDDFGVGYSSLSYLRRIPFDTIKIDRSFVTGSDKSSEDREIIKTIISLANTLRKNTIAEGVTTQSHVDFLLSNDCRNMQGFYFSKPVSFDDAIGLVKSNQALGETNIRPAGGPGKILKLIK